MVKKILYCIYNADASFFIDESLLDCHIKNQSISVKAVEFDMKIINSNSHQLTLLQKSEFIKTNI